MQGTLSYRHRVITEDDLVLIRRLIAEHPGSSRRDLSKKLCVAWNWVQANGALRDMVCRGLMLMLHREGLIELPSVRRRVCKTVGGSQGKLSGEIPSCRGQFSEGCRHLNGPRGLPRFCTISFTAAGAFVATRRPAVGGAGDVGTPGVIHGNRGQADGGRANRARMPIYMPL